jgi:uncharacterized protein with HEPN domain
MSRDLGYLLDILHESRMIQEFVKGIDRTAFKVDKMRQYAVIRAIELIGEASRRISQEFQDKHPEIPWHAIIGMRNRLIHEYDRVDLDVVWAALQDDVPELIGLIEPLIPPEDEIDGVTENNK